MGTALRGLWYGLMLSALAGRPPVLWWLVLWSLLLRCVGAGFFAVDSHFPPFLRRGEGAVLQWDTGKLARRVALSPALMLNHHGLYTFDGFLHFAVSGVHAGFECDEYDDALCAATNLSSVLFASQGAVVVSAAPGDGDELGVPAPILAARRAGCASSGGAYGRVVRDVDRYDVSACDVYAMQYSWVLYNATMYVLPTALSPAMHFCACVCAMLVLSGVLLLLSPEEAVAEGDTAATNAMLLEASLGVAAVSCVAVVCMQCVRQVFVVWEDIFGFAVLACAFCFYLGRLAWTVQREGGTTGPGLRRYDAGLAIDCLTAAIGVLCVGVYSTMQHPFNTATLSLFLFRIWNKLLRYNFGSAPISAGGSGKAGTAGAWQTATVAVRFLLDSLNIALALAYGWVFSFDRLEIAGVSLVPLVAGAYLVARYVFVCGGRLG